MKKNVIQSLIKTGSVVVFLLFFNNCFSQEQKSDFWKNVRFGGGLGLGFGSGYTDITVAPSAIYNFNEYFALGTGLQYSYFRQKDFSKVIIMAQALLRLSTRFPKRNYP